MKNILKNYKSTLILVIAVIIGVIVGLLFKNVGVMVKPLGDIFINLLLVIIVPLIFLATIPPTTVCHVIPIPVIFPLTVMFLIV